MDTQDTQEGNTGLPLATSPWEDTSAVMPASGPAPSMFRSDVIPTPDLVIFWMEVDQNAMESGDLEGSGLITVPLSSSPEEVWQKVGGTVMAFPVIGSGTTPDKYVLFNWQVLSELCQLAAKHRLGSPAVAKMLRFITANELTPYDINRIAKLLCAAVQYMVFLSAWRSYAEEQELKNSRLSQQDPCFGAGVPQLMGLCLMEDP